MSSIKETQKRTVFKALLDNPYTDTKFPEISSEIQTQIVDFLLHYLKDFRTQRETLASYELTVSRNARPSDSSKIQRPKSLDHIFAGFNSVVGRLSKQVRKVSSLEPIKYVFVCKNDIKPLLLTSHFPSLCYLASMAQLPASLKLIQLPRGTIQRLKDATGVDMGILGIIDNGEIPNEFRRLLDEVDDVKVDWLKRGVQANKIQYKKPNVKILKTTAVIKPKQDQKKKNKLTKKGK